MDMAAIYDQFALTYHENRGFFDVGGILEDFHDSLAAKSGHLLDLGCGAGEPVAQFFLQRDWDVTGVDFSPRMLALASEYAPTMKTELADMREVSFGANSFDAITAFYSLFHLPSADHLPLLLKWHHWLKPGGKALFTYAGQDYTGSQAFDGTKEFMGQQLYYGHKPVAGLLADIAEAGLVLEHIALLSIGGERFLWVTVMKPEAGE